MGAIWQALVPEPRAAVDAHWDAIAGELLQELGGRLWRNREAAALGLVDLLQVPDFAHVAADLCRHVSRVLARFAVSLRLNLLPGSAALHTNLEYYDCSRNHGL